MICTSIIPIHIMYVYNNMYVRAYVYIHIIYNIDNIILYYMYNYDMCKYKGCWIIIEDVTVHSILWNHE